MMNKYVYVEKNEDSDTISVIFNIEQEKVFAIGERMNDINEEAYMNGYNWEAFFNYYLEKNHPEIMEGMESDPEAGTYVVYYDMSPDSEKRANKFAEIITDLVENEAKLYDIVKKHGDKIAWD